MRLTEVDPPAPEDDVGQIGLLIGCCGLATILDSLLAWTTEPDTMAGTLKLGLLVESLTLLLKPS